MTNKEAEIQTEAIFGKDSFAECDDQEQNRRYYVGRCPKMAGAYVGFMGYSWEEALRYAKVDK